MVGRNDFLIFDESNQEVLNQDEYSSNGQRQNGLRSGIANSRMHNKLFRQLSIMVAAIGEVVKQKGLIASDDDFPTLVSNLSEIIGDDQSLQAHIANKNNPHGVTPTQIGAAPVNHASPSTTYGAGNASNYGHAMASSAAPLVAGTANAGTDNGKYAREGHVHPAQTTIAGNASTATKLATARTIHTNLASTAAASFDGSANVTPGVTGTLPAANGGTGQTSLQATRNAMGLGNTTGALPVANGGTGATAAAAARNNLGAAAKSTATTATLASGTWAGSGAPFTYSLAVSGATSSNVVEVLPTNNITAAQLAAFQAANIQGGTQSTNTIQLRAFGSKPTINIPIQIIVRGDM